MLHHDRTSIAVTWWLEVECFPTTGDIALWGNVGVGNIEGWGREEWGKKSNGDMGDARMVHCLVKSFIFTWNIPEWTTFSCWNLNWRCLSKPLLGKSSQVTPALGWDLRSCRHARSQSLGRSQTSSDETCVRFSVVRDLSGGGYWNRWKTRWTFRPVRTF